MENTPRSRGKGIKTVGGEEQALQMAAAPLTCMAKSLYHLRPMPEAQDQPMPDSRPAAPGLFSPTPFFSPRDGG